MDATWNSAKKVYADNFLQFKLTGESKYRTAYEEALKTMNRILGKQVNKPEPQKKHTNFLREQDTLKGDLMRQSPSMMTPVPSLTWRYITIGGLAIVTFGLLVV